MCYKQALIMSPLLVKLAKIAAVLIFFCFAECAAGSCLSYGHACWGAHGKRNNIPTKGEAFSKDSAWFLSKLVQNPEFRYLNERDLEIPSQQLYYDTDILKSQDDDNALSEDSYARQRLQSGRIRSSKFVEKRSPKMI